MCGVVNLGVEFEKSDRKFAVLEEFKHEHRHCNMPRKTPKLGSWVSEQNRTRNKWPRNEESGSTALGSGGTNSLNNRLCVK